MNVKITYTTIDAKNRKIKRSFERYAENEKDINVSSWVYKDARASNYTNVSNIEVECSLL